MNRGQTTLDFAIAASVFLLVVASTLAFVPGMFEPFNEAQEGKTVAADRIATSLSEGLLADPSNPYKLEKGCVIAFFALENSDGDPDDDDDAYPSNNDEDGDASTEVRDSMLDITTVTTEPPYSTSRCNFAIDESIYERIGFDHETRNIRIEILGDADRDGNAGTLCIDATDPDGDETSLPDSTDPIIETDDPYASGTDCDMTGDDHDVAFVTGDEPSPASDSVVVARRVATLDGYTVTIEVSVW